MKKKSEPEADVNRPTIRTCPICSGTFKCNSNGRTYCFKCSPPQLHGGRIRKDGMVSGTGELENANQVKARTMTNMYAGSKVDKDRIPSKASPVPERILDKAVKEVESAIIQERARGKGGASGIILRTPGGDEVLAYQRPDLGWGKCKHIDPVEKKETCLKERWSENSPFCREHIQFWKDKREENQAKKIMEEEVNQYMDLRQENFFFKNAQDVMDFLSRINYAVYKNWIPIGKARALSAIARVQIKALDSKIIAHRLHAIIDGLNKGGGGTSVTTPDDLEEMEEDIERGRMMGLEEMARLVHERMPEKDGARVEFKPGDHPDINPPDPVFPVHNEDAAPSPPEPKP